MKKLLISALLAASAVCTNKQWVAAYTNEEAPRTILSSPGLIDLSYDYFFDIAYKLFYKNEIIEDTNNGLQRDALGFNVHSRAKTQFYLTLLDIFTFEFRFEIIPFDITPLDVSLSYNRAWGIIRGDPLTLLFTAAHDVVILDIVSTWRKDIKLPHVSFFDMADGNVLDDVVYPQLKFQETDEFEDSLLSIDVFDYFVAQKYPSWTHWYGKGKYCDFDFINDW